MVWRPGLHNWKPSLDLFLSFVIANKLVKLWLRGPDSFLLSDGVIWVVTLWSL